MPKIIGIEVAKHNGGSSAHRNSNSNSPVLLDGGEFDGGRTEPQMIRSHAAKTKRTKVLRQAERRDQGRGGGSHGSAETEPQESNGGGEY